MSDGLIREAEAVLFASVQDFAASGLMRPAPLPFRRIIIAERTPQLEDRWLHTRSCDLYIPHHLRIKRTIDCLIALPLSVLVLPIVLILALAIKLVDPGPAIYRQLRVGQNGRPVPIFKLRTMYLDAELRLQEHLRRDAVARAEWGAITS